MKQKSKLPARKGIKCSEKLAQTMPNNKLIDLQQKLNKKSAGFYQMGDYLFHLNRRGRPRENSIVDLRRRTASGNEGV